MKNTIIFLFALLISANYIKAQAPTSRITFTSISQMMAYAGSYTECFFDDIQQGGYFVLKTAPAVIDSGMSFPCGKAGKAWVRDIGQSKTLYLSWFGAKGDGITNDYYRIKAFTDYITRDSTKHLIQKIFFGKNSVYWVDKMSGNTNTIDPLDFNLTNLKGVTIDGGNCTIKTNGNFLKVNSNYRQVKFRFDTCQNIIIQNLTIDQQNQLTNKNNTAESAGNGFHIVGCRGVLLENCTALNAQADGFTFGSTGGSTLRLESHDITMINCRSYFAARNSISVIQAVNFTAINCLFKFSGQQMAFSPASGCDIEPNYDETTSPAVFAKTGNILFSNCVFTANHNSQFTMGGDGKKSYNITIQSCFFSDLDSINGVKYKGIGGGDYSINLQGEGLNFINNIAHFYGAGLSLGYASAQSSVQTSVLNIQGNKFYYHDSASAWIRSAFNYKDIRIINNLFIGDSLCTPIGTGLEIIKLPVCLWENNYVFVPKQKFRLGGITDFIAFASFQSSIIRNSTFASDLTPTYIGAISAHWNIELKGTTSCENVRCIGTTGLGYNDVFKLTPIGGTYANSSFINTNLPIYTNTSLTTDTLFLANGLRAYANKIRYGTAIPTTGDYIKGDIIFNAAVVAGGAVGWICTTASSNSNGGTWKVISSAAAVQTSTASIVLAIIAILILLFIAYKYFQLITTPPPPGP